MSKGDWLAIALFFIFRRARFFGTHAPRDKENQPEMPERKHAGAPLASWCDRVVAKLTP